MKGVLGLGLALASMSENFREKRTKGNFTSKELQEYRKARRKKNKKISKARALTRKNK